MSDLTGKVRRTVILGAAVAIGSIGLASPASAQTGGTGYQVTDVRGTTQVRGVASGTLPRTGTDTQAIMTGAGLLLLAGGAAVHLGRTRSAKV